MLRALLIAAAFAVIMLATPASAASDDAIVYVVKRGDTLIELGEKYFARNSSYQQVQKVNGIRNAQFMPIGTKLKIPRNLLKYQASTARLIAVRGDVAIVRGNARSTAASGATLNEGVTLRTAGSSFATLSLENGSRVSLPSNSELKIVRLRKYVIDSSLDYDFDVARGGAQSKVAPLKNPNDRYVVKTPKAVSAVRGTDFQARYDEASGRDFFEVIEGGLAVDLGGGQSTDLPAGNGLAVNQDGGVIKEAMLPAIELPNGGKLQNEKIVRFATPAVSGMKGMRLSIAADAGFVDHVASATTENEAAAEFANLPDGNYFVRARQLSANGIEGLPVTYAFKRRLNSVSASGGASDLGFAFKWLVEGNGVLRYHFQLFRDRPEGIAMVDEAALKEPQISLSDLPAGDYYWRVASVQFLDGEVSTNWTPFEKLSVSAN
jgi:hypothetical protein